MKKTKKRRKPIFAENIVAKRKALGWNAHKLAEVADIPYPTLRDIEAGINAGREDTKKAIINALGLTMAEAYQDPSQPTPPTEANFSLAADVLKKLSEVSDLRRGLALAILFGSEEMLEGADPQVSQVFRSVSKAL